MIGKLQTEGDVARFIESRQSPPRQPDRVLMAELETDPDPPASGALTYCVADNGSGKREVRTLFPTGAAQVVVTEP